LLMARAVLGGPSDAGRASYQIAMTVCERCQHATQQGNGEAIPVEPAIAEMAACDAQHVAPGGRATQTVPPATRREVMRRDGGCCAVPGCNNAVFLDLHHVDPRAEGGAHDPARMLTLCSAHHRAHHRGRLLVEGDAHVGFTFRHADGSPYGRVGSVQAADDAAQVFTALRKLGFTSERSERASEASRGAGGTEAPSRKEREARRGIDQARAHVDDGSGVEALLRAALGVLCARSQAA